MARLHRLAKILVPTLALALVATAGSAHGASTLSTSGPVVTYTAGAADVNDLTIEVVGTDVLFTDVHTINETGFCTKDSQTVARCAQSSIASINISLLDGADTLSVLSINDPIGSADMGSGDDTIILGPSSNPITLDDIRASVSLDGGSGSDILVVKDTQDSSGDIVTISLGSINTGTGDNFFGPGGSATFVQTETVSVTTGTGNSLIRVRSSAIGTSTTIDAGAGDDLFQVSSDGTGQTGDLDGFLGPLTLLGGSGENGLLISDADTSVGNIATLGPTSISGLAPIPILYSATGTFSQALLIRGSDQLDSFAISGTIAGATTEIRMLGGNDSVVVSSDGTGSSGGLSTLAGALALDLGPGANSLAISDADDADPGANASVSISATTISGLAGPSDLTSIALAATGGSIAALTVVGSTSTAVAEAFTVTDVPGPSTFLMGAGNDTFALQGASHPSTIQTGDGNDTVRLGSAGSGLGAIVSAVTLNAGPGSDSLTLDDEADPSADILGIAPGAVGSEPGNSLFGTGGSLSHTALEQVTLNLGRGGDSVTVGATSPGEAMSINAGGGDDFILIPGAPANLDSIVSQLAVDGGTGFNSLIVDDGNDVSGDIVTVTATGIGQAAGDTLFGAAGSLSHTNFALVTVNLGSGDDKVTIVGSPAASISTGPGMDIVELAEFAALNGTIDAGVGTDTLSYEAVSIPVLVELGTGVAHGTGGVQNFENIVGGHGADTLVGLDEERSELTGGKGNDLLQGGTSHDLLDGGPGSDQLNGGRGNDTYRVGGGTDRVVDAAGKDTLDFSSARRGIKVNLASTGKKRQRLGKGVGWLRLQAGIENVAGSKFGDRIIGNGLRNVLEGRGGKDALTGAAGNDRIIGGAGVDRVVESADKNFTLTNTRLSGRGIDRLRSIERATLEGGRSDNKLVASKFKGSVILRGGPGNDALKGGRRADLLVGDDGDDLLTGGKGKDQLVGGPGNDQIFVKDGSVDIVDAGIGWDRATTDTADRTKSVEYRSG